MSHDITFTFDLLDKSWTTANIRDLWAHADLGTFSKRYAIREYNECMISLSVDSRFYMNTCTNTCSYRELWPRIEHVSI